MVPQVSCFAQTYKDLGKSEKKIPMRKESIPGVLAKVLMNGSVLLMDWAQHDYIWSYVSLLILGIRAT
jgi:hypothetical protein